MIAVVEVGEGAGATGEAVGGTKPSGRKGVLVGRPKYRTGVADGGTPRAGRQPASRSRRQVHAIRGVFMQFSEA
jgi:hypothetical protein